MIPLRWTYKIKTKWRRISTNRLTKAIGWTTAGSIILTTSRWTYFVYLIRNELIRWCSGRHDMRGGGSIRRHGERMLQEAHQCLNCLCCGWIWTALPRIPLPRLSAFGWLTYTPPRRWAPAELKMQWTGAQGLFLQIVLCWAAIAKGEQHRIHTCNWNLTTRFCLWWIV